MLKRTRMWVTSKDDVGFKIRVKIANFFMMLLIVNYELTSTEEIVCVVCIYDLVVVYVFYYVSRE